VLNFPEHEQPPLKEALKALAVYLYNCALLTKEEVAAYSK